VSHASPESPPQPTDRRSGVLVCRLRRAPEIAVDPRHDADKEQHAHWEGGGQRGARERCAYSLQAKTILCSSGVAGLRCHLRSWARGAASLGRFCVSLGPALWLAPSYLGFGVGCEAMQEIRDARCKSRLTKECVEDMFKATR
jgi:hypothetical protein